MRTITLHRKSSIVYGTEMIAFNEQKSYLRENPSLYIHEVELQMYMSRSPRDRDFCFRLPTLLFSSLLSWIFRLVHSLRTIVNAHGSPQLPHSNRSCCNSEGRTVCVD